MVGAPQELMRLKFFLVAAAIAAIVPVATVAAATYVVTGQCRDGRPHGAYELRTPDGHLRVAGAFNHGKRVGTFLFWSTTGVRIALLPFADDVLDGTVALWYSTGDAKSTPKPKLEAVYAAGRPSGSARSWYPDGRMRAQYRYAQGVLAEALAWSAKGAPLSDAEARALAQHDTAEDQQIYGALEAMLRDNPPNCEEGREKA